MSFETRQKICHFATPIGDVLYAIKNMEKNHQRKITMANSLHPPLTKPKRRTLKEIEWDLWIHELDRKEASFVAEMKTQKLIEALKNG